MRSLDTKQNKVEFSEIMGCKREERKRVEILLPEISRSAISREMVKFLQCEEQSVSVTIRYYKIQQNQTITPDSYY